MATRNRYALCVKNRGYAASLELRKVYRLLPDPPAERKGLVRIVDESGEDYLFPSTFFLEIELPRAVSRVFSKKTA